MSVLFKRWRQYRHRFVPWLVLNWTQRTKRNVECHQTDKLVPDTVLHQNLKQLCESLHRHETTDGTSIKEGQLSAAGSRVKHRLGRDPFTTDEDIHKDSLAFTHESLGFTIEKKVSNVKEAGNGVFVTRGTVPPNTMVCLYPGTIYRTYDPLFFQSICNQFIFRCIDRVHIDGNDRGLSKLMFRSCVHRDRIYPYWTADATWISPWPINPLAVGQYVNNQTTEFPANVAYQEFNVPEDFPLHLKRYLPYVEYNGGLDTNYIADYVPKRLLRAVALVSLRSIDAGEELFSTYFTVIGGS